jgi:hypothetical protein
VCTEEPDSTGETPRAHALLVDMDEQIEPEPRRRLVAKRDHLAEFPRRVDMQQRKRRLGGEERLHRQVQHHAGILADRIEHHRIAEFGDDFAQDGDRLGLKPAEMGGSGFHKNFRVTN